MNWKQWTIAFIATIVFLFTGNAMSTTGYTYAQTDLNINNTNLMRLGGSVTVVEKQVVENAIAIGGSAIVQPNGRVTQTAIAIGGDVILKQGARVDGDAYAIGGKVVQAEGATIGSSSSLQQFLIGLLIVTSGTLQHQLPFGLFLLNTIALSILYT